MSIVGRFHLGTERLILRMWRVEDHAPFAALNADPEVMRHFPAPLTRDQSDAAIARQHVRMERDGMCFMPVIRREDNAFLGMAGLAVGAFAPLGPFVEVGWRFARAAWGQGYATEAARAMLGWGFRVRELAEIVAFTALPNRPSERVMQRLGMRRDPGEDFDHPAVASGPLRRHMLYRIRAEQFG
ncbi:GNAT family N-acetyltransferase [Paroceanicella profunda]|uniref:GNAT family N-acetyltransferase n=1 Tax=Paroceanicella profunda TaxID=2579971 RepID=A0A5B8FRG8_9RHOB|nr:GNAT family N-acetyltransferase [Paroceanicella profunda]QDL90945.1 GNAT family N-acetyltransferase [Paroceanicella profunda]